MDLEEKLTALWADTESVVFIFNILRYSYYGMVVLGFLIMIYVLFGLTALYYLGIGVVAAALVALIYLVFGQRLVRIFIK